MLSIFYKENGKILLSQSEKDFPKLTLDAVVWIDLVDPSGEEKRAVEAFLGTEIQSRAQAEEIESSSRYFESDDAIFANTNFLTPGPDEYMMQAVSFTIVDDTLTTLREVPLRSFTELQRRLQVNPRQYPSGFSCARDSSISLRLSGTISFTTIWPNSVEKVFISSTTSSCCSATASSMSKYCCRVLVLSFCPVAA